MSRLATGYERRVVDVQDIEVRQNADGGWTFRGYAAVYDKPTMIGGGRNAFREKVAPTAFTRALAEGQDVRHLINHNADLLLGRTASGTTRLTSDETGLAVETDLPDTSYARDLKVLAERRDLTQMSFGFRVPKGGDSWATGSDGVAERTLVDLDALDVSSVTFPAYPETTGEVRSLAAQHRDGAVAWSDEDGYSDFQSDVQKSLPANPDDADAYPYGWVQDVSLDQTKALVTWYTEGGDRATYVVPVIIGDAGDPVAAPFDQWVEVEEQYVEANAAKLTLERGARQLAELRAGKVLSKTNADHLTAALAAHADTLSHMQAIADSQGDGSEGTEDGADGGAADVTTEGNSASREGVDWRSIVDAAQFPLPTL